MTGLKPICRNAISAAKILASKRGFRLHCLPTFDTFILWIILSFQRQNVITSVAEVEDGSLVPASRDKGDRPQPPNLPTTEEIAYILTLNLQLWR